ncbi:hypothetical protein B0T14DRAFT_568621 [Immersiella caudata]|uniref:Protein kinase domain-containing protein n=1 Tax=Immersiella caudata TaxID=314043 RepID=A0AA40BXC6_9PEZI|nr:hypothetical protein B0T14DRAFT_568621 [Immersiella caudata]
MFPLRNASTATLMVHLLSPKPHLQRDEIGDIDCTDIKTGAKFLTYYCWTAGNLNQDDQLFVSNIDGTPSEHSIEQINAALKKIPNERIFFPLPVPWYFARTSVTVANEWDNDFRNWHIKRPWFTRVPHCSQDAPTVVAEWFAIEVGMLELLRNGRVTGIYLGRVEGDNLWDHVRANKKVDKEPFLAVLESAIRHLHDKVGIAHNDIQPFNIMVSPEGVPTLIDLGSSEKIGDEISHCRMYSTWGEDPPDLEMEAADLASFRPPVSTKSRDLAALNKLRTWLDNPVHPWQRIHDMDEEARKKVNR